MTAEQLEKIKWLNRAFYAEKAAKAWGGKLERDRSIAERLTRLSDGTGSGSRSNSTEDAYVRLAETERKTRERIARLVTVREEITAAVEAVDDLELQAVLVWHYLVYETWETVAEQMHYDPRTVYRKHKKALDKVVIVCQSEM